MGEWSLPSTFTGAGMKPMSVGSVPAVLAASCICGTAQEPSTIVPIFPVAKRFFESSQFVVVGSASIRPAAATS